ncbi:hypothetical protein J2Y67_004819 [Neobacillus niacini]|nr:hypothetical protein [Neobacillus niacini]
MRHLVVDEIIWLEWWYCSLSGLLATLWTGFSLGFSLGLSPIRLIGDTLDGFLSGFVAYRAYWRHFGRVSLWVCRLSGLLATLWTGFSLGLSPIRPVGDTLDGFLSGFVPYPAYWRHFGRVSLWVCRLSGLLATLWTGLSLVLSPIRLIGDTLDGFFSGFVPYWAWRHFGRVCPLSGLLATLPTLSTLFYLHTPQNKKRPQRGLLFEIWK